MTDFLNRISNLSPKKVALLAADLQARLDSFEKQRREPIAIVGVGCRFPGNADSPAAFWKLLHDGVDAVSEVPSDRWDINSVFDPTPGTPGKTCSRYGGFLKSVDEFDALFFGISPREAAKMDPQQRLLLEVAWETLENAGQSPERLAETDTGVFVGVCSNDYARMAFDCDPKQLDMYLATGGSHSIASGRISYLLGLHGPSISLDTACSSSLIAVHIACLSLRARDCRSALAGGVSIMLSPEATIMFSRSNMMATDGRCKTFDTSADGYVRGEGCGMVLLKRLSDAIADGDRVLATIQGSAVNQDGRSGGITAPNGVAQQAVIRNALAAARLKPSDVDFVETHGTGTPLGDPIEIGALAAIYGEGRSKSDPLRIGSVKTNFGHAEGAAGIAGLIKVVLALQARKIPPHLHFKNPTSHFAWETAPIEVPTELTPWHLRGTRRIAAVSSFGFSGTNAHVIVAEAEEPKRAVENVERGYELLTLSAKTPAGLQELVGRYAQHLSEHPEQSLGEVCRTANVGRSHFEHRLATVVSDPAQLRERLQECAGGEMPLGVVAGHADLTRKPEVVFLFTGQGGQYLEMGKRLYETEPVFREVIDRCAELVRPYLEKPLQQVLYPAAGESSPLDETQYTHVAMFAVQYGLAQLWRSWGIEPAAVMGHSVGEIVAATVAGGMSLEDGLMLMRERGRLMASLPRTGRMASLLAGESQVAPVIDRYRDRVAIAAINGPESTVISGEAQAVEQVLRELEGQGIKTKPLNVSNSFHSPLVEPVLGEFTAIAKGIEYGEPQLAQFSSMRLGWVGGSNKLDGEYWGYNLRNTVRFSQAMAALYKEGYRTFIEIGPSPTLVSMASQCVPQGEGLWLASLRRDRNDWDQLLESLATLYVNGATIDWKVLDHGRFLPVELPTTPFQREKFAIEKGTRPAAGYDMGVTLPSLQPSLLFDLAQARASLRAEWVAPSAGSSGSGVVRLLDENNNIVAEISGLGAQPKRSGALTSDEAVSLNRSAYKIDWQHKELTPAQAKTTAPHSARSWLILADGGGLGAALSTLLTERGDRCALIFADHQRGVTTDPADMRSRMQAAIKKLGTTLDGVIHLWALDCPRTEDLNSDALRSAQAGTCGSILSLLQALRDSTSMQGIRLYVVSKGTQAVGSVPTPLQVAQAPLRGVSRVISMEHPELRSVHVDLDPKREPAAVTSLLQELSFPDGEDQVAFRDGSRFVARLQRTTIASEPNSSSAQSPILSPDATYLVTGGLGDLGLEVARWMVANGARHLALIGRRAPSAQAKDAIRNLEQAGVKVFTSQSDVSKLDDLKRVFAEIQSSMPTLRGIVHAAGVWKGGVLLQQKLDDFLDVLAPKVEGAWNLHQLTESMKLDFFVSFSSGASVLGAPGLADYAAANSFLDALAHLRHSKGLPGASINWGPWAELGMARTVGETNSARWSEHGMSVIPPHIGLFAMEQVIRDGTAQVCVLPIDWKQLDAGLPILARAPFVRDLVQSQVAQSPAKKTIGSELALISEPIERERFLTTKIQAEAARILRLSISKMEITRGLNQFGMDSLMALELRNRLQSETGLALPLASLLSGPSVSELASLLLQRLAAESLEPSFTGPAASPTDTGTLNSQEAQELLQQLPNLSEQEIESLLGRIVSKGARQGQS